MLNEQRILSIREKALKINLDPRVYGSFAEIGAGQETAANFFKVGGASGSIAKTMSAYDMKFSDAIYGKSKRYVCEDRLHRMLDHELNLLTERLGERANKTNFFAFANTVETLNFHRSNQGHGWLGLKFQLRPEGPINECIIHVLLHDNDTILQQQAIGVLGVNLIYACFYIDDPELMMLSFLDNLSRNRIEVDYFKISGPDFRYIDNRVMALKLVKNKLTQATMFDANGTVLQPKEALYKQNLLLIRGRFRPVTHVNMDMIISAQEAFKKEPGVNPDTITTIAELTLQNLAGEEGIDEQDFLHRVDILGSLGIKVLISDYVEYFRLATYISQTTKGKIGIVLGVGTLQRLFDESFYAGLHGGILESFGNLFKKNIKLFVYPALKPNTSEVYTCKNLDIPGNLDKLFAYLRDGQMIQDLDNSNIEHLDIFSDNVVKMIKEGETGWEEMVPEIVAKAIKEKGLFGHDPE